jgi:hypothetical protein
MVSLWWIHGASAVFKMMSLWCFCGGFVAYDGANAVFKLLLLWCFYGVIVVLLWRYFSLVLGTRM